MGAVQAAVTHTPISTVLVLVFTAGSFQTDDDDDSPNTTHQQVISAALPFLVIAVTAAVFLSEASGCFYLHNQASRTKDMLRMLHPERGHSLDSDFSSEEEEEEYEEKEEGPEATATGDEKDRWQMEDA